MKKGLVIAGVILAAAVVFWMLRPAPPPVDYLFGGKKIICFGDSLTFGTGAPENMSYPAQLSRILKRPVVNAGFPGDTTASALSRLKREVLDRSPGIVLLTLGGNDMKNRIPADTAFENLKIVVERIQKTGALVVLGGISIPFWDRGFSERYRTLAEDTGVVLVENVYEGILGNRSLMSDTIHPNADGYRIMAEHFAETLEPYVEGS
ncbi:MAG: arylesterase [Desulfobacterales bacterium]|nr:arylesterase [Desulfobacterales bacterium]